MPRRFPFYLLVIFTCFSSLCYSQTFQEALSIPIGDPAHDVHFDWGDYDGDGDLDLVLNGGYLANGFSFTRIFRNDGGTFVNIQAGLTASRNELEWGDYDGDGDLDLLLEGKVVRNVQGRFVEQLLDPRPARIGAGSWGDYDNDGDLDFFTLGSENSVPPALYRNDGGTFSKVNSALGSNLNVGSAAWGDYDGDGGLDLLISGGSYSPFEVTRLYRNTEGVFSEVPAGLPKLASSNVAWGDFDQDGDLDILIAGLVTGGGHNGGVSVARIFRNDQGTFVDHQADLPGLAYGEVAWGDYDNDGDPDVLLSGGIPPLGGGPLERVQIRIFRNDRGKFTDSNENLPAIEARQLAWADYDNDGDLDLLGFSSTGGAGTSYLKILRNQSRVTNAAPGIPTRLRASVQGTRVTLEWDPPADDKTSPAGLSYALYLRKGADTVLAAQSAATGFRRIVRAGRVQTPRLVLNGIVDTVYHFSVQAVDASYKGSAFAPEFTFVPPATLLPSNRVRENRPSGTLVGELTTEKAGAGGFSYQFTSGAGDADNGSFLIEGTQLKARAPLDYERKPAYSLRLKIFKNNQVLTEKIIQVRVEDEKETPSDILLSGQQLLPGSTVGTVVGLLSAADQDAADTHIFSLAGGAGGEDNAYFVIHGHELRTATVLPSGKEIYRIRLSVTDGREGSYLKNFSLDAVDGVREAEKKLLAFDGKSGDMFGRDVDISGNYAIVGASGVDNTRNNDAGAVYLYQRTPSGWVFQQQLLDTLGTYSNYFGQAVAISGDYAAVGAWDAGAVLLYKRDGNRWNLHSRLKSPYSRPRYFGYSVDIDQGYLLVGETNSFGMEPAPFGYVYVYKLIGNTWTKMAVLSPGDGFERQKFGYEVALSGDLAVITSNCEAATSNYGRSDTYLFRRTGEAWSEVQKITPPGASTQSELFIRGIDIDGKIIAVGTPGYTRPGYLTGAVFLYEVTQTGLQPVAKLTPPDSSGSGFGHSVSLRLPYVAAGAVGATGRHPLAGAVFLFARPEDQWVFQTKVFAKGPPDGFYFGGAVALSGEFLLTGMSDDRTLGSLAGAAYLHDLTLMTRQPKGLPPADLRLSAEAVAENLPPGSPVGMLTTVDPDAGERHTYQIVTVDGKPDSSSFIIRGDSLFTGRTLDHEIQTQYRVSIRTRDQTGGTFEKTLVVRLLNMPDDPGENKLTAFDGKSYEYFGASVALSDQYAITGAISGSGKASRSGAVYIYRRADKSWKQSSKITPEDNQVKFNFGSAVTITGNYAAVAAVGSVEPGSVYLYHRQGEEWALNTKLSAPVASTGFGKAIALLGDTLVVGDPDVNNLSGLTYIYLRENAGWVLKATLAPDNTPLMGGFGNSVSLSAGHLFVGTRTGNAAYVYQPTSGGWQRQVKMTPPSGQSYEYFGALVSVWGSHAMVSTASGNKVYPLQLTDGEWKFGAVLYPARREYNDNYGSSITLWGEYAAIGAPGDNGRGGAYLFRRDAAGWKEYVKLKASDGDNGDGFGGRLALYGNWVLAGATGDDDKGDSSGAAYLFDLKETGTPSNLRVKEQAGASVTLQWSGTAIGPTRFIVERSPAGRENFTVLDSTGAFQYRDSTFSSQGVYLYRVRAYTPLLLSGYSNEVTVSIRPEFLLSGKVSTADGIALTGGRITLFGKNDKDSSVVLSEQLLPDAGVYSFTKLPAGRYTLQVKPDTALFPNLLVTYFGNQLSLSKAVWITVGPSQIQADVRMLPAPEKKEGRAIIQGRLVEAKDQTGGRITREWQEGGTPIANTRIYLLPAPAGQAVAEAITNSEGAFTFKNLQAGSYSLLVDYRDTPMDPSDLPFILSASEDTLRLTARVGKKYIHTAEQGKVTAVEYPDPVAGGLRLFPNPAGAAVTIGFTRRAATEMELILYTNGGRVVKRLKIRTGSNPTVYTLEIGDLYPGFYILEVRAGSDVYRNKFLKQ